MVTRNHEIEHGNMIRGEVRSDECAPTAIPVRFLRAGAFCAMLCLAAAIGCSGTPDDGDGASSAASTAPADTDSASAGGSSGSNAPTNPDSGTVDPRVQEVLDDLTLTEQEKRSTANFYLQQGQRAFGDGDYRSAVENFEKALTNDPMSRAARDGLAESLMLLGRRDGEIQTIIQQLGEEITVGQQARLVEVRQHMESAREYLEQNDAENALREASRAREQLIFFNYDVDISELQAEAMALYDQVRDAKIRQDREITRNRQQSAAERADEARRRDEENRRSRIAVLVDRVQESMKRRNFDIALETADSILALDPENEIAKRLRNRASDMMFAQRKTALIDRDADQTQRVWEDLERITIPYEDPFNFPDETFWRQEVQPRLEGLRNTSFEETPEVRQMRRELAKEYPSFVFPDSTLGDAISYIRTLSGLNITVDPEIDLEESTVNLSVRDVKLGEALDLILEHTGFAYTFKENTLFITTPDNAFGDLAFDVYNVSDLLNKVKDFPGPQIRVSSTDEDDGDGGNPFSFGDDDDDEDPLTSENLADLIKESTGGEDLWDESGSEIVPSGGQLLITATRELHLAVSSFLENLRANADVFVIVETRFIDMVDDFLEDIGVDSRNLGQPPGQGFGTAFGAVNSARTGGTDTGFNNLGDPSNPALAMGQDRTAGRVEHILDGFVGAAAGERLTSALRGLTLQVTWLDPFQINAIVRATQEQRSARTVTAPRVTASNGQRVHVSVITQRSYVQDYELVSGGTGQVVSEVADPVIDTFQDGVVLDVRPVISSDRKYITLDVRPTLASLINGVISTVTISLGTLNTAASQVEIDLPEISLQQAFTSVTVPDGGTVLLGGFRSLNERKYESSIPLIGKIPFIKNAFRRKAYLNEKRSLYILITAKVVDLRAEEKSLYN